MNPSGLASVSCGEVASIACHATGTNTISFAVATETQSFGSHTFERNSPRSAKVGPLELTLLEAVADPRNPFLTIFNVNGSEKHVMSYLMINCTDAISTRHVEIKTTSKLGIVIYILKQFTDCLFMFRTKLQCTCALGLFRELCNMGSTSMQRMGGLAVLHSDIYHKYKKIYKD